MDKLHFPAPVRRFDKWDNSILDTLQSRMPPDLIKNLPGDAGLTYMPWRTYADILDAIVPKWSMTSPKFTDDGKFITVELGLTIHGVTRHQVGVSPKEDIDRVDGGDPYTIAYSAAFRRAAAMFGLGRFFYIKDGEVSFKDLVPPRTDQQARIHDLMETKEVNDVTRASLMKADPDKPWTISRAQAVILHLYKLPGFKVASGPE